MNNTKVACPFCKPSPTAIRGEGCCNCDHSGMVPIGDTFHFKSAQEATTHDPEVSYLDLAYNRRNGLPLNFNPFK